jgi:hypothetical protein
MIQVIPKQLADLFKEKDINRDGNLKFDGFKAAILKAGDIKDFKMTMQELKEIFNLLSKKKLFMYAEYIMEQDATNRVYFSDIKNLSSIEDSLAQSSLSQHLNMQQPDLMKSKTIDIGGTKPRVQPTSQQTSALQVAKQKIEQFMIS